MAHTSFSTSDAIFGDATLSAVDMRIRLGEQMKNAQTNEFIESIRARKSAQPTTKGAGMFCEIRKDVTNFVSEYRSVIYFVALALIVDSLVFNGVFRARLQVMVEKLIAKVEERVA